MHARDLGWLPIDCTGELNQLIPMYMLTFMHHSGNNYEVIDLGFTL